VPVWISDKLKLTEGIEAITVTQLGLSESHGDIGYTIHLLTETAHRDKNCPSGTVQSFRPRKRLLMYSENPPSPIGEKLVGLGRK
jgi:hypothetical protein